MVSTFTKVKLSSFILFDVKCCLIFSCLNQKSKQSGSIKKESVSWRVILMKTHQDIYNVNGTLDPGFFQSDAMISQLPIIRSVFKAS